MKTLQVNSCSRGALTSARLTSLTLVTALVIGCVATTPSEGANDPSSANAPTAATPTPSPVLNEDHMPLPEAGAHADGTSHDHGTHSAHRASPAGDGHDHAKHGQRDEQAVMYICPMHPEVRQGEPGRCPKCGMALELEESKSGTQ